MKSLNLINKDEFNFFKEGKNVTTSDLFRDVTQAIGMTPIVRLNHLMEVCIHQNLYLKLESCNPGGSIKEKNAVFLIESAEKSGLLKPGGTIIESSSGNFGIGLSMVGAAKGYRVIIVVDAKTPPPVRRMLQIFGAELVDVPLSAMDKNGSMQVARMKKAEELAKDIQGSWYVCQHLNPMNPQAHFAYTAREIEKSFRGAPDVIIVGVSTAGQIRGLTDFFLKKYPQTIFVAVDVAGSAILGTPIHPYKMTGLGLSFFPPAFDPGTVEYAYSISDQLAFSLCHQMARREGLFLGASTGAIVAAGLHFASQIHPEKKMKILMINPDRGERYLETIYNPEWLLQQEVVLLRGDQLERTILGLEQIQKRTLLRQLEERKKLQM